MDCSNKLTAFGIIPARFNSSRFPGKPLADINGKSMIRRVFEQAVKADSLDKVFVATDDTTIFHHVKSFTDNVFMTSPEHHNGTERIAEVIDKLENFDDICDIAVNIQGDEPFIDPSQIDAAVNVLRDTPAAQIATLVKEIDAKTAENENVVKAVVSLSHKALYFSRAVIPFRRNDAPVKFFKHVGLYAFRTEALKKVVAMPVSALEMIESLEQLRWLENGFDIYVAETNYESVGIDTPADIENINLKRC